MIVASIAFPSLVALALVTAATSAHRRLPPWLAARFVTVALVLVVVAVLPMVALVALAYLAHAPVVATGFRWCARAFGLHGAISPWIGLPAVAMLTVGAVRAGAVVRCRRAFRHDHAGPVHVAPSANPYAVTLPGRGGRIVISTAMVELLDAEEQRVVLAHERAHARYRHDRYVLVAELAAAVLPPLRTLARRVRFSIERWADEAAAAACGDRGLVAITIGKTALQAEPRAMAGFSGLGVASRMEALLAPPVSRPRRSRVLALWASLLVAAGFVVFQLHHLERLAVALCPH